MSDEIVRDHRTEQCRPDYIRIDWLRPIITAMLGESFGDLFQRWRKLRLSVLAAFLGHSAGGENLLQRLSLFFGRWFVDLECVGAYVVRVSWPPPSSQRQADVLHWIINRSLKGETVRTPR
jgi:hypothetical protein